MSGDAAPVAETQRIKSLDVVRGLAVLGILAVNAAYFAAPYQAAVNPLLPPIALTPETAWGWLVVHVGFELKMVTLFSMLFGASLYMVGGETDDEQRGLVLRRRLAWMFIFGLIHGALIWYGDILLTYAVCGLGVMFVRSWAPQRLLANALILFGFAVVLVAAASVVTPIDPTQAERLRTASWAPAPEVILRSIAAFRGDAWTSFQFNFSTWWYFTVSPFSLVFIVRTAALMLAGMALYKWGFFSGSWPTWRYVAAMLAGAVSLALIGWQAQINLDARFNFMHMTRVGQAANNILSPFVSLFYASALILLVKFGLLRFATDLLAAVGRMAFTNYIAQSIIMTTIFYGGRGFGLYGEVDRVTLWGIVVAIWTVQLIWSPLWLARFQMGPLEWLWRRLSYARPVAFSR